jgi:hypothetical protein
MWRSLAFVAFLAAVVAASAAARDPWDPRTKFTKADQAAAKAAVLSQADLGQGWRGGPQASPSFKAPTCPAMRPPDGDLTLTGHAESLFSNGNGGFQIVSDIEIFTTAKQATARFNRFLQPKLFTCLRYALTQSLAGTKVTFLPGKRLDFKKVAERTAVYRLPIVYQGQTIDFDYLFLGKGRSQFYVNIVAPSIQEDQLPAFELRLAKVLVGRAVR